MKLYYPERKPCISPLGRQWRRSVVRSDVGALCSKLKADALIFVAPRPGDAAEKSRTLHSSSALPGRLCARRFGIFRAISERSV